MDGWIHLNAKSEQPNNITEFWAKMDVSCHHNLPDGGKPFHFKAFLDAADWKYIKLTKQLNNARMCNILWLLAAPISRKFVELSAACSKASVWASLWCIFKSSIIDHRAENMLNWWNKTGLADFGARAGSCYITSSLLKGSAAISGALGRCFSSLWLLPEREYWEQQGITLSHTCTRTRQQGPFTYQLRRSLSAKL